MFIDEDPLGLVKFVNLFKINVFNFHVIMMNPDIQLIIGTLRNMMRSRRIGDRTTEIHPALILFEWKF